MLFAGAAQLAVTSGAIELLILTVLAVVATGLTAAYYLWFVRRVFYGPVPSDLENVNEPPKAVLFIGVVMVIFVIVVGVYPWLLWRWVNPVLEMFAGLLGGG
jgi:NADH:ubiquinone oxidoreductase subunit 4 (subunit M)